MGPAPWNKSLNLRPFEALAESAFAHALDDETVQVTEPRLGLPAVAVLAVAELVFGEIEGDFAVAGDRWGHHRGFGRRHLGRVPVAVARSVVRDRRRFGAARGLVGSCGLAVLRLGSRHRCRHVHSRHGLIMPRGLCLRICGSRRRRRCRRWRIMHRVIHRLGQPRTGAGEKRKDDKRLHAAPPSTGRTWTTRIIPIAMWRNR